MSFIFISPSIDELVTGIMETFSSKLNIQQFFEFPKLFAETNA